VSIDIPSEAGIKKTLSFEDLVVTIGNRVNDFAFLQGESAMFRSQSFWLGSLFSLVVVLPVLADDPSTKVRQKLYITNALGDDITVVDVATNKVIHTIKVGSHPHGIALPASEDVIFLTIEADPGQLVWLDPVTDKVVRRMNVGPRPNQLAVTPDGKLAYVPVEDGNWEIVDTQEAKIIDRIHTGGRPHNTLCSADGKHMFLAPMAKSAKDNPRVVLMVDVATRKMIGRIRFSDAVRPIALSRDERRFYANIDNLIGMEVADVFRQKVIYKIAAEIPEEQQKVASRSHGIAIRPDQKELWTCDVNHHLVYVFDISGTVPQQTATIPMGGEVYWLTFTPDGKICYVSVRGKNMVAAVDTVSKKILTRIPSGEMPKRLIVVTVPEKRDSP
jgi:YVTN family beta-propeller protein